MVATVNFAAAKGLPLATRGGAHSFVSGPWEGMMMLHAMIIRGKS